MWYLYWDFHIFGVMFGSLLLGSVISYFYQLMRIKKRYTSYPFIFISISDHFSELFYSHVFKIGICVFFCPRHSRGEVFFNETKR